MESVGMYALKPLKTSEPNFCPGPEALRRRFNSVPCLLPGLRITVHYYICAHVYVCILHMYVQYTHTCTHQKFFDRVHTAPRGRLARTPSGLVSHARSTGRARAHIHLRTPSLIKHQRHDGVGSSQDTVNSIDNASTEENERAYICTWGSPGGSGWNSNTAVVYWRLWSAVAPRVQKLGRVVIENWHPIAPPLH